ncbi:MAG: mechanosensitive ion channel family protein [Methylotenera sp.]|nr:mechanosensitive ion channel family protein [Methylotenera sp.]
MHDWLQVNTLLNIHATQWLYAVLLTIFYFSLILGVWKFTIFKLKRISANTVNVIDDVLLEVLQSTEYLTFAMLAILLGMRILELPEKWVNRLDHVTFIVLGIQVAIWVSKAITVWTNRKLTSRDGEIPNPVITAMLSWVFKVVIWTILLLTVLANVGVNITAFVTSLGIGGVAVALAVQNILSDLFASLSIGLDKPFVIGDFIVFGNVLGTVERIGLKTTHIRSLDGEQIVCSNTELLKNTIHNYKRMSQRRVVFGFGVRYDTPPDSLEKIPAMIKKSIEKIEKTRFDRAHFKGFGTVTLDFEVVYFIVTDDFNLYMDIQQSINLTIMRELKALNVDFALPGINLVGLHPILRMDLDKSTSSPHK